jgi:hypothetical protein
MVVPKLTVIRLAFEPIGGHPRALAEGARGKLERHGGFGAGLTATRPRLEGQGNAADHTVHVGEGVDRADVPGAADGETIAGERLDRLQLVLDLAQHHPPLPFRLGERDQEIAVEAFDVALHRGRENDVEADHPGAGVEGRGQDLGQLFRPHDLGRVAKRRPPVGLFIDGDDDGGRCRCGMAGAEGLLAQPEKAVERHALQPVERRQDHQPAGDDGRR